MGFFDDPFDDIINEFFSKGSFFEPDHRKIIRGEADERKIGITEFKNKIYLIFSFPGYDEKDIKIKVQNSILKLSAKKKNLSNVQDYLFKKLNTGVFIEKKLPSNVKTKKFSYTFKNGVLEMVFNKKWKKII